MSEEELDSAKALLNRMRKLAEESGETRIDAARMERVKSVKQLVVDLQRRRASPLKDPHGIHMPSVKSYRECLNLVAGILKLPSDPYWVAGQNWSAKTWQHIASPSLLKTPSWSYVAIQLPGLPNYAYSAIRF